MSDKKYYLKLYFFKYAIEICNNITNKYNNL